MSKDNSIEQNSESEYSKSEYSSLLQKSPTVERTDLQFRETFPPELNKYFFPLDEWVYGKLTYLLPHNFPGQVSREAHRKHWIGTFFMHFSYIISGISLILIERGFCHGEQCTDPTVSLTNKPRPFISNSLLK